MSNYLLSAILTHHNKQVKQSDSLIYASSNGIDWTNVTGYTLQQLKEYLNR